MACVYYISVEIIGNCSGLKVIKEWVVAFQS